MHIELIDKLTLKNMQRLQWIVEQMFHLEEIEIIDLQKFPILRIIRMYHRYFFDKQLYFLQLFNFSS